MGRPRIRDMIMPGSIRTETTTWTRSYVTIRCGRCGHEQDASADGRTATCKACSRTCHLDQAIAAGSNVTPMRRNHGRAPTPEPGITTTTELR